MLKRKRMLIIKTKFLTDFRLFKCTASLVLHFFSAEITTSFRCTQVPFLQVLLVGKRTYWGFNDKPISSLIIYESKKKEDGDYIEEGEVMALLSYHNKIDSLGIDIKTSDLTLASCFCFPTKIGTTAYYRWS